MDAPTLVRHHPLSSNGTNTKATPIAAAAGTVTLAEVTRTSGTSRSTAAAACSEEVRNSSAAIQAARPSPEGAAVP